MTDENNLTKVTTFGTTDLIRLVVGGASRNITKSNFVAAITQLLIDAGFLNSASESLTRKIETITGANHSVIDTDDVIFMDTAGADRVVSLPAVGTFWDAATSKGQRVTVKKIDASNTETVTITPIIPSLIDGEATATLETDSRPFVTIISDGANWWLI